MRTLSPGERRFGCFAFAVVILAAASLWSPKAKKVINPVVAALWPRPIPFRFIRPAEHAVAFALATLVTTFACRTQRSRYATLVFMIGTAVMLEVCQHWLYTNDIEWFDVIDNLTGVLIGYGLLLTLGQKVSRS